MAFTPTSSRYPRTFSPPLSSGTGSTIGPHVSRLNIVTRLAIEGNAKEGDGVPIRMYLRLTIPADSVTPGSTIPLFKEENVKIVASDVHPLDHASTPYNFSSAQSPLLHNAARALGLPARLSQSYMTLFSPQSTNSSRYMSASGNVDALDERYTGYVTISGWQVSFVLPKELPPRSRLSNSLDDDRGEYTPVASKLRSRRSSIGEKNMMQFMVGIRMAIPYTSRPPRAPWLLSIPTPRCLSNSLRLRIFPIQSSTSTSSSYQSLSSEGESEQPPWDVTADPHVTRLPTSRRSAYQHQNFADDEGSDSASPGFSEDVGVQGTFPSTERIRIRWAQPQRTVDDGPTDGRRRVGVETVQGEMLCEVLGRATERTGDREGVVMRLEYKGSCKGVWFPGVATLLGLDVGLEAKGCDVGWARHHEARWTVIGDVGYTGHEIGTSNDLPGRDRQMVFDMPQITSPDLPSTSLSNGHPTISRHSSSSSTASLLRIPLPASQNSFEYSFEGSPAASGSEAGLSSVLSTTDGGSKGRSRASSVNEPEPPSTSITLHLNISDILPPNPEPFTFTISGTVLVMPRSQRLEPSGTDRNRPSDELAVSLPRFRAFAADTEMIRTTVRNAVDATVGGMSVSASSDIKAKQTELKPGGRMKLGSDGGRVTLHSDSATRGLSPFPRAGLEFDALDSASASRGVSPTPLSRRQRANSNASVRDTYFSPTRPSRTGELMIPYVNATITPFLGSGEGYAVRLALPAPVDHNRDWLDIYLAHPSLGRTSSADSSRIKLISATLEDVPVQCQSEIISRESKEASSIASLQNTDDTSWLSLLRVYTGTYTGGIIELVYSVDGEKARKKKTKSNSARVDVMLPIFEIPVGRLQVDVMSGQNAVKIETNFEHQHIYPTSTRLCHFHMQGPFAPSVTISPALAPRVITPLSILKRTLGLVTRIATILALLSAVFLALTLYGEIARVRQALDRFSQEQYYYTEATAPVVTVTATILSPTLPFGTQAPLPTTDPISAREPDKAQMDVPVTIIEPAFAGPDQPKYHSTSTQGDNALLPLHYVYDWRYFLFSRLPTVDGARRAFFSSLGFVWSYVRWGFHYPLD